MIFQYTDISLNEFPGEVSLVIYSGGCNMYCPFCFNPELREKFPITFKQVKDAVQEHKDFITAVVLTGGEPSFNPQFGKIMSYLKDTGLKIKVNTNGLMPKTGRGVRKTAWIDYLHVSLKPPKLCICTKPSTMNFFLSGKILEYSFVYSKSFFTKLDLNEWVLQLNHKILGKNWWENWTRPDIFTISQMQIGHCLNKNYNTCSVPTREELLEVADFFKNIPTRKLIIETREFGREVVWNKKFK